MRCEAQIARFHSRPQSPSFLGHVVGKIKPSGSGDENGQILATPAQSFPELTGAFPNP